MPGIVIGPTATVIPNNNQNAIAGSNDGITPVYMSELPDVSPSNNQVVVSPGVQFSWPNGKTLYACVDPGLTGHVSYANNGASVGQGQVFNRASNVPVLLTSFSTGIPTTAVPSSPVFTSTPDLDISQFSSIIIRMQFPVNAANTVVVSNYVDILVGQTNVAGQVANPLEADRAEWWMTAAGINDSYNSLQVPVKSQYLNVTMSYAKAATAWGGSLTIEIYGSNETINETVYVHNGAGMSSQFIETGLYSVNIGTGVTYTEFIPSLNREYTLSNVSGLTGTAGYGYLIAYYHGIAYQLPSVYQPSTNPKYFMVTTPIKLPNTPIQVNGFCAASPAGANIQIVLS